nr:AAA family ATPase [Parasphaerochaeta coccoides]
MKTLEMIGFKSFADKTKLDFADGITCLLGPNGCGKSNIVDSIKWVLGEQSTKALRASRMDDVIFNGTDNRKPMGFAEVSLTISNEEGHLAIDAPEVEIRRRVYRNGNAEYYINRSPALLKNIKELFLDTGVGKSAYSILEQGKIDQILSHKPEDRRYIFEEAAGISRFKTQMNEAQRKLERTMENLEQVDAIFTEAKRTYTLRKGQAERVVIFKELEKQKTLLEVDTQLSTLKSYLLLKDSYIANQTKFAGELKHLTELLEQFENEIGAEQERMQEKMSRRSDIQSSISRLEAVVEGLNDKLSLISDRFREMLRRKDEAENQEQTYSERLERERNELAGKKQILADFVQRKERIEAEITGYQGNIELSRNMIAKQEGEIERKEADTLEQETIQAGLNESLQKITDDIVMELDKQLSESGYSSQARKRTEKQLIEYITALVNSLGTQKKFLSDLGKTSGLSATAIMESQEKYLDSLEESLDELKSLFQEYSGTVPVFIDEFLAPQGIITQKHDLDKRMAASRRRVQDNRIAVVSLRESNQRLDEQVELFRVQLQDAQLDLADLEGKRNAARDMAAQIQRIIDETEMSLGDVRRTRRNVEAQIADTQEMIRKVEKDRQEAKDNIMTLREELEILRNEMDAQSSELSGKRNLQSTSLSRQQELRVEIETLNSRIMSLDEMIQKVYTDFYDNTGKSLKEYDKRLEEDIPDTSYLREQLNAIKQKIANMGTINHMAEDEFEQAKERYEFLNTQIEDLNKAKRDLEEVVTEIRSRSEELFMDSYTKISANFQSMFRRLFGGGRAELNLVDPENILESGIDILAQPPGKKLTNLTLLSGGERSMTAVAMLFATYMVKPSPFSILDEIDAALDDKNVGNFLSVLQEFGLKSQFIIITHNKHTVTGGQTLLGVTQQEAGISTTVSYRVGNQAGAPVIVSEQGKTISLDSPSEFFN